MKTDYKQFVENRKEELSAEYEPCIDGWELSELAGIEKSFRGLKERLNSESRDPFTNKPVIRR